MQGRLELDAPLDGLLEGVDLDRLPNGRDVTVRDLMQMSSGIPDYMDLPDHADRTEDPSEIGPQLANPGALPLPESSSSPMGGEGRQALRDVLTHRPSDREAQIGDTLGEADSPRSR